MNTDRSHLLFLDDAEFDAFVRLERERRRRSNDRPPGARLSTDCPVRMVQAVYDEQARISIDAGDAERGHEMESRIRATLLAGVEHDYQPPVVWASGVSAFDVRTTADGMLWDFKSTKNALRLHSEYVTVTQRRMVAAGMSVGSRVGIIVASPTNYRWAGPFHVVLTGEAHELYTTQLGSVAGAFAMLDAVQTPEGLPSWRSARWWREQFGLACTCGGCVDHTRMDASSAIESMLMTYEAAIDTASDAGLVLGGKVAWKWASDGLRARLIAALDRAAERHKPAAIENGTRIDVETDGWRCSWNPKTQQWRLNRKPREPDSPIPDALKNDVELAA